MPYFRARNVTIGVSMSERRIVELLADGYTDRQVADILSYDRMSITKIVSRIAQRADVRGLTRRSRRHKLVHMYLTGDLFMIDNEENDGAED